MSVAYAPGNATRLRQLGVALLQKDPDAASAAFERAVALNPFETDALLGLALRAEAQGNNAGAETLYRQAIASSRRFKPRYALAVFYARTGRTAAFWAMASSAAEIDKCDIERIVRLACKAGAEPDALPELLNLHTEHALASYIQIAMARNWTAPLARAALRLPVTPERRDLLFRTCDRLIDAGASSEAVALWNRLNVFTTLDPAMGRSLTNPEFAPSGVSGFNWRYASAPGVDVRHGAAGLEIELSGDEAENVFLAGQTVPVVPRRTYRFSVVSEPSDPAATAGIGWRVECAPDGQAIGMVPFSGPLEFVTPADCEMARIVLSYARKPGTVRLAGTIALRSVALELLP
jgi:hypothetical protein